MLLDGRKPIDMFVVGERLIVSSEQASNGFFTCLFEGFDSEMAIENNIKAVSRWLCLTMRPLSAIF